MSTATLDAPHDQAAHRLPGQGMPIEEDPQFIHLRDVPVFAEHETVARNKRRLRFSRQELEAVAERCNRRISESGDYAALTLGHTPDPAALAKGQASMPEVVGFAGPFRVGAIGGPGQRQRYAILADFHVFKEDFAKVKKHPRRSPELWLEDRYEEMFLDPIALLGAEAPRLDLGLLYTASRGGRLVERYAAASPSSMSVFTPQHTAVASKKYQGEGAMTNLQPDDVRMIVDAMEELDWVQWVKAKMAEEGGNASFGDGTPPEPAPEAPAPEMGAEPPMPGTEGPPPEMGGPPPGLDAGAPPPAAPPAPAAGPPEVPPLAPPAAEGPPGPPEEEDDEQKYAAGAPKYPKAMGGAKAMSYSRNAEIAGLQSEVVALRAELNAERGRREDAERYSALSERRRYKAFDLEREFDRCKYGTMSADQFSQHLEAIDENYQPIPLDLHVPTFDGAEARAPGRPGSGTVEKYSREVCERAGRLAAARAMRGEPVDYLEVLDQVASGKATA